jgi:hypothetical protein
MKCFENGGVCSDLTVDTNLQNSRKKLKKHNKQLHTIVDEILHLLLEAMDVEVLLQLLD